MPEISQTQESVWHTLIGFIPQAKNLSREQRLKMTGWMRQSLLLQEKEKTEAQNVFRLEDAAALRGLVESLPFDTEEEIVRKVEELQLDPDKREMEIANWTFRHQSAEGELLVQERLVPFKIIRLRRGFYLLLCREVAEEIVHGFSTIFGKPPDVFSGRSLKTDEQSWNGWVWMRGEQEEAGREMLTQIRSLWKETGQ